MFVWIIKYDRTDASEVIDINQTSASKQYNFWHYWYFLDKGFNCEPYLCNGFHDLMQKELMQLILMTLPLFLLTKMIIMNSIIIEFILVYEQRWCNNYNEKF